ncbi:MAG TPA: hypothetical protein VN661_04440 [Candidatus Acidoferrales bacterium]|nr:hypothetical protein [Candidatus Acidoferrales bacterium]
MRVLAGWMIALVLVAMPGMTAAAGKDASKSAGATRARVAAAIPSAAAAKGSPKASEAAAIEAELQELRQMIVAQSAQLKQQQDEIRSLETRLAASAATPGKNKAQVSALPSAGGAAASAISASGAKSVAMASVVPAPQETPAAQASNPEVPVSWRYKGITLTPGGFMAAETVWRGKALGSDINTPFNSLPVPGSSPSGMSEFFGSGRQSRIAMLAEGKLAAAKIGGYYEGDFLSSGVTSNNNESNSYTFRQRQFWAQAAFNSGWTITGGQMWSLVTETKKGLDNRSEALPMTIDAQYHVGFSWARQYGFRVTKNLGNKLWLGFSVENPQITLTAHGNAANALLGSVGATGGLYNNQSNYSFNKAPDLIFKAAAEPGWGHFEIFGVVSQFRDRIFPCATASVAAPCSNGATIPSAFGARNDSRTGGGIGANARVSLMAKHLDLGIHFLGGSGVGRYGTTGLPDATLRPDGTLALVRSYQALGTAEFHNPKFDIYTNFGGEFAGRTAYGANGAAAVGYGSPFFNNSGCFTEPLPGTNGFTPGSVAGCTADTRNILEGTAGFWYRFYKGPMGMIQWGPQFSYVIRHTWSGTPAANGVNAPRVNEPMLFTSFRYYLP